MRSLLLPALLLWSAAVEAAPCRYRINGGARYPEGSPECALLDGMRLYARRLAAAGGLAPGQIDLANLVWPSESYDIRYHGSGLAVPSDDATEPNPALSLWLPLIQVSAGFVACHRDQPETSLYSVAHEVAHAVQLVKGNLTEAARLKKSASPEQALEIERRLEGEADQVAFDLLEAAGLRVNAAASWDRLSACSGGAAPEYLSKHTHPSTAARWIESVAELERQAKRSRASQSAGRDSRVARALSSAGGSMTALVHDFGLPAPSPDAEDQVYRRAGRFLPRQQSYDIPAARSWTALTSQGRRADAVAQADFPAADASGRVRLPDGRLWAPPPEALAVLTPGELAAYALRGNTPPTSLGQGVRDALQRLKNDPDAARRLPGEVFPAAR